MITYYIPFIIYVLVTILGIVLGGFSASLLIRKFRLRTPWLCLVAGIVAGVTPCFLSLLFRLPFLFKYGEWLRAACYFNTLFFLPFYFAPLFLAGFFADKIARKKPAHIFWSLPLLTIIFFPFSYCSAALTSYLASNNYFLRLSIDELFELIFGELPYDFHGIGGIPYSLGHLFDSFFTLFVLSIVLAFIIYKAKKHSLLQHSTKLVDIIFVFLLILLIIISIVLYFSKFF